jgi:hypothetical protein
VPAVLIVTGALVAPALSVPVAKRDASCVASCAVVSLFIHATVWPTRIVVGFGEKDWVVRSPTIEIVTSAATVGADGLELPQADPIRARAEANIKRRVLMMPSLSQAMCRSEIAEIPPEVREFQARALNRR